MSRRLILLAGLSLAAIFMASFVLLQGDTDYSRPKFPTSWGSFGMGSSSDAGSELNAGANAPDTEPLKDPLSKPPSDALVDPGTPTSSAAGEQPTSETEADAAASSTPSTALGNGNSAGTSLIAPSSGRPVEISITEMGGSHDEVVAALVHAFGRQPNTKLKLWLKAARYGIRDIWDQFKLSNPLPQHEHKDRFKQDYSQHQPDIVISTTCEYDSVDFTPAFKQLLEIGNTYLFCVIHHADRWDPKRRSVDRLVPWIKAGLVTFVALSQHTQHYIEKESEAWMNLTDGIKPKFRHMVPVYPVDLSNTPEAEEKQNELAFALQGDYSSGRRNYGKIFSHLGKFLSSSESAADGSDIQLHLIGHGTRPEVPKELSEHVQFDENLAYLQFYGILSRQFALLPAFASDTYLDRKASSSVPASLIAGVPLVATQKILDSYAYLPSDAVWMQDENEDDFDVIDRIIHMTPAERKQKSDRVQEVNRVRIEMNEMLAGEWIREGLALIRERKEKANGSVAPSSSPADAPPEGVGSASSSESSTSDEEGEPSVADSGSAPSSGTASATDTEMSEDADPMR